MDFSIHTKTISKDFSIFYFKRQPVKIYKFNIFLSPMIAFILAISVDPDEMLYYAAFYLVIHCCLLVSRMEIARIEMV